MPFNNKQLIVIAVAVLALMAIVNRVAPIRKLVEGA